MTADVGLFVLLLDRAMTEFALPVTRSLTLAHLLYISEGNAGCDPQQVTHNWEDDFLFTNMNVSWGIIYFFH